jgi:hypothetical protein
MTVPDIEIAIEGPVGVLVVWFTGWTLMESRPVALTSLAVIVVKPGATAVTTPVPDTVATLGVEDCQDTLAVTGVPPGPVAVSWTVRPGVSVVGPITMRDEAPEGFVGDEEQAVVNTSIAMTAPTRARHRRTGRAAHWRNRRPMRLPPSNIQVCDANRGFECCMTAVGVTRWSATFRCEASPPECCDAAGWPAVSLSRSRGCETLAAAGAEQPAVASGNAAQ